jgi:hypothetical protein
MEARDASGREQRMFCVHLDTVPMWLVTIEAGRVRPEGREKLVRYQKEAARALAEHFMGGRPQASLPSIEAFTAAVIPGRKATEHTMEFAHCIVSNTPV